MLLSYVASVLISVSEAFSNKLTISRVSRDVDLRSLSFFYIKYPDYAQEKQKGPGLV